MGHREELSDIGSRILSTVCADLFISMHYMGPALGSLGYVMDLSTTTVGTDAEWIRFNPNYLMRLYLERPRRMNRTYLHMVLHCLFRHMFYAQDYEDRELWDLCCDIAVESVIDSMECETVSEIVSDRRSRIYQELQEQIHVLTAQKLYRLMSEKDRDYARETFLAGEFGADDHSFWARLEPTGEEKPKSGGGAGNNLKNRDRDGRRGPGEQKDLPGAGANNSLRDQWEKSMNRVKTQLEISGSRAGKDLPSELVRVLAAQTAAGKDLRAYLKHFMVLREEAGIDPDSFDPGFYNYGMQLYGNMPLIEENELRERVRVEELVIAIDTSASCQWGAVQEFLNETAAILLGRESFFRKVRIHILQCDEQVRSDLLITDPEQMKEYAGHFAIRGGGGTDFRPVFSYVEELRRSGELKRLRGLLYFTDGYGIYPARPTAYETAFVFERDADNRDDEVPDWALRLYV